MNDGRVPPQAIEVEEQVLSAILLDSESVCKVLDVLNVDDFYKPAHRSVFAAMIVLFTSRMPIDLITLSDILRKSGELEKMGGEFFLSSLTMKVSSSANIEYHAHIILEMSLMRQLISASSDIINRAYNTSEDAIGLLQESEQRIFSINERCVSTGYQSMAKAVLKFQEIFEKKRKSNELSGIASGFIDLDEITAGFQQKDLIIIAGRPSQGKTAFALSIARKIAKRDIPIGFFSLESSTSSLVTRILSSESTVNSHSFRVPHKMSADHVGHVLSAIQRVYSYPIYIDDSSSTSIIELRAKARRMCAEHKIQIMFVDYLQLMVGDKSTRSREQEVSSVSRGLKAIAKDLNIPVVALSQLNRLVEARQSKRPMLSDLRESGAIEQDADIVMFIHRPETYGEDTLIDKTTPSENMAELIISKNREGESNT